MKLKLGEEQLLTYFDPLFLFLWQEDSPAPPLLLLFLCPFEDSPSIEVSILRSLPLLLLLYMLHAFVIDERLRLQYYCCNSRLPVEKEDTRESRTRKTGDTRTQSFQSSTVSLSLLHFFSSVHIAVLSSLWGKNSSFLRFLLIVNPAAAEHFHSLTKTCVSKIERTSRKSRFSL